MPNTINPLSNEQGETPKDVSYGQTPKERFVGLTEVAKEKDTNQVKQQEKIKVLEANLNNISYEQELLKHFISGKEVYEAIKNDPTAIQKKIDEFNAFDTYRHPDGTE
jgi:hypothetical protein